MARRRLISLPSIIENVSRRIHGINEVDFLPRFRIARQDGVIATVPGCVGWLWWHAEGAIRYPAQEVGWGRLCTAAEPLSSSREVLSAGGGTRTRTEVTLQGILSPIDARLNRPRRQMQTVRADPFRLRVSAGKHRAGGSPLRLPRSRCKGVQVHSRDHRGHEDRDRRRAGSERYDCGSRAKASETPSHAEQRSPADEPRVEIGCGSESRTSRRTMETACPGASDSPRSRRQSRRSSQTQDWDPNRRRN